MQAASSEYKREMKKRYRDERSFIRVTIGMINQTAQASARVAEPEAFAYFSSLTKPFDNYQVTELYAGCDENWTAVDGSMYFLPRRKQEVVLNAGLVTEELLGEVKIRFSTALSIKGLTIEFGKAYPVDFTIESDQNTVAVEGNDSGHFVTEEIFPDATFLRLVPAKMVNGQSRFRIHQITMGIGIYFDNRKILSAVKKEHISPITEELPSIDFSMTAENRDRAFDVENSESSVQFLEIGQNVEVVYGQELEDGTVEWMPGARLALKDWSADDEELEIGAADRFDGMEETYYRGRYEPEGLSLYDAAEDVFRDAGVDSREYYIDPYLKEVRIQNPVPAVTHKEALQLIANAGRCILYQDREGKFFLKSSFIPDMKAASEHEAYFSHAARILDGTEKEEYALAGRDYSQAAGARAFLPREGQEIVLNTGFISDAAADGEGNFPENPTVTINLEAAFKCFGLTLEFGRNTPKSMIFHAYYNEELQEDYQVSDLRTTTVISHEFPSFDRLVMEFTKGAPGNRVILDNVLFGDSTDYSLEYGTELTKTPKGTQLTKVKELQVVRTLYGEGDEEKELAKETFSLNGGTARHTFYLSNPSYGISAALTEPQEGQTVTVVDSSAYYVTVEVTGTGAAEIAVNGWEYTTTQVRLTKQLHTTGTIEVWENPLVSDSQMAEELAQWIGDYLASDREYSLSYRGEPRLDANDIAFLENKYVPDLLVRIYDHTLNFNGGALSGTIKARRDMSGMVRTKNRLEGG